PPKVPGKCDLCSGELYQRDDDKEETVRKRIEVYEKTVPEIINYYKENSKLRTVSGDLDVDDVHSHLSELFLKERLLN
ncbi:MAG: adenylate kinase, partial [Omnitrophica WOR_2 bacterium SM23_29]